MHRRLLALNDRLRDSRLANFLETWAVPIGLLMLIASIWVSSYTGRVQIYSNAVAGCVRGQTQRADDIDLNTDLAAFMGLARIRALRAGDEDVAKGYFELEQRAQQRALVGARLLVVCTDANKPPRVIEFRALTPHPQAEARRKARPAGLPPDVVDLLRTQPAP